MTKHMRPPFERKNAGGDSGPSLAEISALVVKGNSDVALLKSEMDAKVHGAVGKIRGEIETLVEENLAKGMAEIEATKKVLNEAIAATKRPQQGDEGGERKSAERIAYEAAFKSYFRKGVESHDLHDLEAKALSVASDPDGGYTVLPEMDTNITDVLIQVSPMRQVAQVRTIGSASLKKLVNQRGTASGWVAEGAARGATANATLSELEFPTFEIYAKPYATQTLLDDSNINIEEWLAGEVQTEFAYQEGLAFISGTGSVKPKGFIGGYSPVANASYVWGRPGFIGTGASAAFSAIPADDLVNLYGALKSEFRGGASWLMNSNTATTVRKIKDASGQYYLMSDNFSRDGAITTMMGRPVVEMPGMDDIAASSYSIAFGDWQRSYLIIDRMGTRVLRDPYSNKPFVEFYTTKRVGGGVQNFETFKLLKFI